ncbi:hypothetical protein BH09BAC1_BH09BAC1_31040 [soil metagenome]
MEGKSSEIVSSSEYQVSRLATMEEWKTFHHCYLHCSFLPMAYLVCLKEHENDEF